MINFTLQGPAGNSGILGKPGENGAKGFPGLAGRPGSHGKRGDQGATGMDGPRGLKGRDGKNVRLFLYIYFYNCYLKTNIRCPFYSFCFLVPSDTLNSFEKLLGIQLFKENLI